MNDKEMNGPKLERATKSLLTQHNNSEGKIIFLFPSEKVHKKLRLANANFRIEQSADDYKLQIAI